jgi:hypothetical protein
MKKSTKAALLSGLVFPGLGHVYLRRYAFGLVLLLIAGWATYSVTVASIDAAYDIAAQIDAGTVAPESGAISQLIEQRSQRAEQATSTPGWVLMVVWLVGIVDSWRVGRAQK